MKNIYVYLVLFLLAFSIAGYSQSKSFLTLQDRFEGRKDVTHLNISSFFVRMALCLASEDLNSDEISNIGRLHLMVIPKDHFAADGVTLNGYIRFVEKKDSFEELINIKDKKDNVRLFVKTRDKYTSRYLLLVDDEDEVVAIEFSGNINPDKLFSSKV